MKISPRIFDYVIWVALGLAVVIAARRRSSGPEEGAPAAPIDLPLVGTSGRFQLSEQKGKAVVIEVFAGWCGTCRRATPVLSSVYKKQDPKQVTFVGVSLDESAAEAERVKNRWGIPYAVALDDGSLARNYEVSLLPTVIVIGRDGIVRHTTTGVPSESELNDWLAER